MTWLGTVSGKKIDLVNPDPDQIDLRDIAHALARIPRFNGHTTRVWSVLDHSVAVASLVANDYKLQALLHDAAEAYICDIPTPLKELLGETYRQVERGILVAIGSKFKVDLLNLPPCVKSADAIMLMTEHDAMQHPGIKWERDFSNGIRVPQAIRASTAESFMQQVGSLIGK